MYLLRTNKFINVNGDASKIKIMKIGSRRSWTGIGADNEVDIISRLVCKQLYELVLQKHQQW